MAKPTKRTINSFHQSLRLCEFPPIPNNGFSHSGHFRSGLSIPSKSHEEIARNPCFGGGLSRILFAKTHRYPPCIGNRVQSYSNGVLPSGFRSSRGLDAKTSSSGPLGLGSALNPTSPIRVFSQIFSPRRCFHTSLMENSCKSHSHGAFPSGFSISRLKIPYRQTNLRGLGYRFFSSVGKFDRRLMIKKPLEALSSTASRYRGAIGLQIEAFWKRNYLVLVGAVAVVLCLLLWRVMFGIANMFVGFSEGMAKYGFLALAWAMVAFTGLYIRSRLSINPDKVYRIAMRKLNTSAGILEVMGAPLTGTDLRAYVMSGGGPSLKNFKLKLGGKRCFLIFPIRGSERRALVSVEVKKKKGQELFLDNLIQEQLQSLMHFK
ncbi:hypothetical protein QJS04_geneDACA016986 [Acorus gramineus]|uniref:Uncharacterized protein n=1 Tax=Acorus gramineus TaxID=55184 RepID=A0AAV9ALC0_ACOGR|nr:hypothetical protein QJS04_geneDACA016986 [Acorus gramineus]